MIVTTNLAFGEWPAVFGDPKVTTALLDRSAGSICSIRSGTSADRRLSAAGAPADRAFLDGAVFVDGSRASCHFFHRGQPAAEARSIPSKNGAEPVARRRPTRFSGHLIVLVILSALPFVLLSFALSMYAAIEERRQMLRDMEDTSDRLQIAIDRELEVTETILRVAALSSPLRQAISAGADGPAEQRESFHTRASELVALRPDLLLSMVLHDRMGRQIVNTLQPLGTDLPSVDQTRVPEARAAAEPDLRARSVFEGVVAAGEVHITDLFFGPVAQRYLVAVLLPIRRDGEVVAVLSANILPSALGDLLREQMSSIGYVVRRSTDREPSSRAPSTRTGSSDNCRLRSCWPLYRTPGCSNSPAGRARWTGSRSMALSAS